MFQTMQSTEIKEIGQLLKIHRLVDPLAERIQKLIPTRTGVKDSVYRAFRDADTHTDYMNFIRKEGMRLLKEKGYAVPETA